MNKRWIALGVSGIVLNIAALIVNFCLFLLPIEFPLSLADIWRAISALFFSGFLFFAVLLIVFFALFIGTARRQQLIEGGLRLFLHLLLIFCTLQTVWLLYIRHECAQSALSGMGILFLPQTIAQMCNIALLLYIRFYYEPEK